MSSFWINDEDKGISTKYWIYLEGVSLDFDSSWTPESEVRIYKRSTRYEVEDLCLRMHDCPRSLVWKPSISRHRFFAQNDVMVEYKGHDGGLTWTGVIAGWKQVVDLAGGAIYQGGIAHLQIGRQLGLGTSTVNLIVRRTFHYDRGECFKLSVVMEYINRDEWSCILEYQQRCSEMYCNDSIAEAPLGWRGNERIIEEMPKSRYQKDQKDVADVLRHIAHESMPLVLKYRHAQSKAAERGLSLDDFLWESPNHHETRIVCTPSSQTDSPLRALRLDIHIIDVILHARDPTFFITIDLALAPITCSPSHSISFSTCTLRLDVPYAELANATIPNFSSQILSLSTDSRSAERVIATNGPTQTINLNVVQVMAPVAGDVFAGPISGGNNGGRNNTNNITTLTPRTSSRRKGGVFLLRRFELLPALRGIFRTTNERSGAARGQEGANDLQ